MDSGQLGALLGKEFLAQDLPKFAPKAETATELLSRSLGTRRLLSDKQHPLAISRY
jgi:hypothetical protein